MHMNGGLNQLRKVLLFLTLERFAYFKINDLINLTFFFKNTGCLYLGRIRQYLREFIHLFRKPLERIFATRIMQGTAGGTKEVHIRI